MRGRFQEPRRHISLRTVLIALGVLVLAAAAFGVWKFTRPAPLPEIAVPVMQSQPVETPAQPEAQAPSETPEAPAARELEADVVEQTPPEPAGQSLRLMAVGDDLIHNSIYWSAELPDGSYDFTPFYQDIAPVVAEYDLACIQQETIFVSDPALYDNYPRFASPTAVGDALAQAGFNVVTMAGNHCYDKGMTGITDTLSFWREQHPDVTVLGIHDSQEDADTIRVVEQNGLRVALLDYTYGVNYEKPENAWTVDFLDRDKAARDLENARAQADFVIVFAHWGEEGEFSPNDYQRDWAEFFAAQNVDAVIGGHPHVVQRADWLEGTNQFGEAQRTLCVYSLGNFLSGQCQNGRDGGVIFQLALKEDEGRIAVDSFSFVSTWVWRTGTERAGYTYSVLPVSRYRETPLKDMTQRDRTAMLECDRRNCQTLASGSAVVEELSE